MTIEIVERVRSTVMEDFREFMEQTVPENRHEFDWHDPSNDPDGMYAIDCKINTMPKNRYLCRHCPMTIK